VQALFLDDDGKPKLALCYKTQKDADDAAAHLAFILRTMSVLLRYFKCCVLVEKSAG
jgi:hypothetical protein